ncbi:Hemin transport protein hemS [Leclercia adecarboxylata]|uniref:Hemin transport protein hemS n=1 Tax=Leclercia adecarboxylata TaxID=83655 RepID=A0A4U9HRS5_9ENTR|nr:Hemin transport protein hemS [Leclercia adecarboxylata]
MYTTDNTDVSAWGDLLSRFIFADNPPLALKAADPTANVTTADAATVDSEWRAMTDVHQFFGLLKRHSLTRQQAFRLVSDDLACQVDNRALSQLLNDARQAGNEIMIFRWQPRLRADLHRHRGQSGTNERLAEHFQPGFYPASAGRDHRRKLGNA